ncbi:MAG TPA: hypothetical protein VK836_09580 [Streptosporangiaceae bacterium]|nr:hypothetical protein [Streptosporangiaceae bacterium]
MGFAWMAEGSRHGVGRLDFDTELDDGWDRRFGDGLSERRSSPEPPARRSPGPGRHAQPRVHRTLLGGLGVAGISLRPRPRSDQARRPSIGRGTGGAHAAGRAPGSALSE